MNENRIFFRIDDSSFNPKKQLIIAELGTGHNGDLNKAKKLIDAASKAGADCVKFQMVYADEILHPKTGNVSLPGGKVNLYDRFKALEAPLEFYEKVKEYTESGGLLFLCTPFGLKSASLLEKLNPKFVKIASPELNYTALLEKLASWKLPILLSTGVSRLADIEKAILTIKNINTDKNYKQKICLLHCVTSYPAPETDYNLRVLPNLAAIFGVSVGVSDHSADPCLVPALATSMGALVIEKHFCLSRSEGGLDDPIALPPDEFAKMVKAVRNAAEAGQEETLSYYCRERGYEMVEKVLGNGIKELAASERGNFRYTNRSIHALRDISVGEKIKKSDYAVLRTEKNLKPGLDPGWEDALTGRIARNFIPAGEGITFEDI